MQLSSPSDMAVNAVKIFEVLVNYLVTEHIDYAIELGLLGIFIVLNNNDVDIDDNDGRFDDDNRFDDGFDDDDIDDEGRFDDDEKDDEDEDGW